LLEVVASPSSNKLCEPLQAPALMLISPTEVVTYES